MENSALGGGDVGVANSQAMVHVEVITSNLVTRRPGEGRRARVFYNVSNLEETKNGLRNFKKFRKVCLEVLAT